MTKKGHQIFGQEESVPQRKSWLRLWLLLYIVGRVHGVTQLDHIAYVVSHKSPVIKMYTADTLSPLGEGIHVEGMKDPCDIVACRHDCQLYVADKNYCIWRVSVDDRSYVTWLPTESATERFHVRALSLTSSGLLVTSRPRTLRQYNTLDAQLLRDVQLAQFVSELYHGVETSRGTFVVGHRGMPHNKQQYAVSELFSLIISAHLTPLERAIAVDVCLSVRLSVKRVHPDKTK